MNDLYHTRQPYELLYLLSQCRPYFGVLQLICSAGYEEVRQGLECIEGCRYRCLLAGLIRAGGRVPAYYRVFTGRRGRLLALRGLERLSLPHCDLCTTLPQLQSAPLSWLRQPGLPRSSRMMRHLPKPKEIGLRDTILHTRLRNTP